VIADERRRELVVPSPREREVLALIAMGEPDKEIAARLGIGISTVRTYLRSIRYRLNCSNRGQLTAWAVRHQAELIAGAAVDVGSISNEERPAA
jgi:DNA-binding CsgD family transcriptional regulator